MLTSYFFAKRAQEAERQQQEAEQQRQEEARLRPKPNSNDRRKPGCGKLPKPRCRTLKPNWSEQPPRAVVIAAPFGMAHCTRRNSHAVQLFLPQVGPGLR